MKKYINAAAPITLAVLISTFASTLEAGQIVNFNWYSGVASVCRVCRGAACNAK